MKLLCRVVSRGRLAFCSGLVVYAAMIAGCGRDDVKVYQVARDDSSAPPPQNAAPPAAQPAPTDNSQPQLQFALPPGWQQVPPSQMRVASFSVANSAGPSGDVGIIPLPAGENELSVVNMWREQLQLPPADHSDSQPVNVGGAPAKLFELVSDAPVLDNKYRQRICVAMLNRGAMSWFFKFTGEESFITSQKEVFLQFLKSVSFSDDAAAPAMAPTMPATAASVSNDAVPSIWTIPAGWQSVTPSQFLLAQFVIQDGVKRAEVNVSQLAGQGGGLLANVNRWRRQLGLAPVDDEDAFSKMVDSFNAPGGQAQMVDFSGTDSKTGQTARLVGVVVPQASQTWFYKLMGDPNIVAAQKDAFLKFIQSARYPDAR